MKQARANYEFKKTNGKLKFKRFFITPKSKAKQMSVRQQANFVKKIARTKIYEMALMHLIRTIRNGETATIKI